MSLENSSTHSTDSFARQHQVLRMYQNQVPDYTVKNEIYYNFSHFDSRTIDFLRRINTLFTGVNLTFDDLPPRTILDHLSPLIHGIHSMSFLRCSIPQMEQSFGPKLAQVKMLKLVFLDPPIQQTTINFFMNWLTSEEQREPRYLELDIPSEDFQQFIVAIQEVIF
jgi:hypothetical protein